MGARWQVVVQALEAALQPAGLDLVAPLSVGVYNAAVPEAYKIPLPETGLLVMVGNTKRLWEPFLASIDDLDCIPEHPLNEYAMRVVTQAVSTLIDVPDKVYWVHETEPGKMVAAQRMIVASGLANLSEELHLTVHPTFGPWYAQRAVVAFGSVLGPTQPVFAAAPLDIAPEVRAAMKAQLDEALSLSQLPTPMNWTMWLRPRITFDPKHAFMYSPAQTMFHYSKSVDDRRRILRAAKLGWPLDNILETPSMSVLACRHLLQDVLQETAAKAPQAILLSGGLDTSILAQATPMSFQDVCATSRFGPPILSMLRGGITVRAAPEAQDAVYAARICEKLGQVTHHCLEETIENLLLHARSVSRLLVSFDPMELRNSIVIYRSLLEAKALGYTCVVTGDGADELFAGYSFFQSMDTEKLAAYRLWIARIMRFSSKTLAASMGIDVLSPFLDPRVVAFALARPRDELISDKTPVPDGNIHGKRLLRQAFPEATSQWRAKEPIEQGAGTTQLRKGYFDAYPPNTSFDDVAAACYAQHRIVIRDREHLYFSGSSSTRSTATCAMCRSPGATQTAVRPAGFRWSPRTTTFAPHAASGPRARRTPTSRWPSGRSSILHRVSKR
ncbi:hypothetical protein SPRG_08842 [Saprolegnia parasitica CBS 223.65]|uniref:Asparagine synthetase domain-containing protein n=1 Tax=Saprolegnia parasitica (strain CBS 223.65) TaxID=695850 RepID=A0A067CH77_SAPPC|nr:hypothetical protein SPRG_08842 [Saprolegnia parasitica CBS 223.65]KDO25901.1 hypothetical protein SPRG_08842 [Saprolegnia parasitica CBS 223.65]|eukprot:XP_012203461.1 hypothetical protein SPRG_08842 [Saprolegnia parasitica CBS 223.65]